VIFFHDAKQRDLAEKSKAALGTLGTYDAPIVTEIKPLAAFYKAEDYHQGYFDNNPNAPYCTFVIKPKLHKLKLK
jgi:peptide-methionine (S)-S-oxide reductase